MNSIEIHRFFNTVFSEAVLYPDRYAQFRSLGFEASEWPDCPAKSLMLEFQSACRDRGEDQARILTNGRLRGLDTLEGLPEDQNDLLLAYQKARTIGCATQLADAIRRNPFDAEQLIEDFRRRRGTRVKTFLLAEELDAVTDRQEKKIQDAEARIELPGWEKLSRKIGGFNPGRVSMLVAKTGVGKTMLALNLADAASAKMGVMFFNMEMSSDDIVARCIQMGSLMQAEDWFTGKWKFDKLGDYRERVMNRKPIIMTDGRALTLGQIIGQTVIAKDKYGIGFVVVDYDQKIRVSGRDEEWRQVQRAVEELEECAKANSLHIMVLAQGDDEGEVKSSKRAQQSASTIFEFFESKGKYGLRSKKNRFGARTWRMKLNCDPSMSLVSEGDIEDEKPESKEEGVQPWLKK